MLKHPRGRDGCFRGGGCSDTMTLYVLIVECDVPLPLWFLSCTGRGHRSLGTKDSRAQSLRRYGSRKPHTTSPAERNGYTNQPLAGNYPGYKLAPYVCFSEIRGVV